MNKKKILYITISILFFTFIWGMFFSSGLPFFWEDFESFHLDKSVSFHRYSILKIVKDFVKEFFATHRLFQVGFGPTLKDRPYEFLTEDLLGMVFTDKIVLHRMFKCLFFAMSASAIFFISSHASILLSILGVFLYMASAEVWLTIAYNSDLTLYTQTAILFSVIFFLKLLEKKEIQKSELWLRYIVILILTQYSILAKNDGRYLAIIFFLTIIFFRRNILRLHLPMLTILLFMEVPILGYFKKIFLKMPFYPINIASYNSLPINESLKLIWRNRIFPTVAIGQFTILLLVITFLTHVLCVVVFRKKIIYKNTAVSISILKERLFFFMLWFICSFSMMAIAKNFNLEGLSSFMLNACSFFIIPFIIFLCYYVTLVRKYLNRAYGNIFISLCIILLMTQISVKLVRLNQFRGAWGNYFCAWRNAEKYIDNDADRALALTVNTMQYKPFVFRKSNNEVLNSLIVEKQNFSTITNNIDKLFLELVENGYLDNSGVIQNKFRSLKDATEIRLSDKYSEKQFVEIFNIIKKRYIVKSGNQSPFCNLEYIESKLKDLNYKDVFVVSYGEISFKGISKRVFIKEEAVVDGDSGDLYDRIKRFIGRPSKPVVHIYHFKFI